MASRIIEIKNETSSITTATDAVRQFASDSKLSDGCGYALAVVFDELLSNIMRYGYDDKDRHNIKITLSARGKGIKAIIEDDGIAFNPLDTPEADTTLPLDQRDIGGLGIHLVKRMMTKAEYKREAGKNVLTLFKTDG